MTIRLHGARDAGRHRLATLRRLMSVVLVAGVLASTACGPADSPSDAKISTSGWHEFQGTWTATGNRRAIQMGTDHRASIVDFDGSLLLAGSSRPAIGFRAEALVLNDSATGMVGRAVWTDDRGDQVFSELKGGATATGNRIAGTFIGGTGRYAGATGTYEFSWRFVLEAEDGTVQGQSLGLNGKLRVGAPRATPAAGGPQP